MNEVESLCYRYAWDTYKPTLNAYLRSNFTTLAGMWQFVPPEYLTFIACTPRVLSAIDTRKLCGAVAECVYPYTTAMTKTLCAEVADNKDIGDVLSHNDYFSKVLIKFTNSVHTGYHPWQDALVISLRYASCVGYPDISGLTEIVTDLVNRYPTDCGITRFIRKLGINGCN